jgi:hypothetical protein
MTLLDIVGRRLVASGIGLSMCVSACAASESTSDAQRSALPGAEARSSNINSTPGATNTFGVERAVPPRPKWLTPYPKGRWRLADPAELQHVVLWVSQILIRHREVRPHVLGFKSMVWPAAPQVPQVPRSEALRLAESVAAQAAAHPENFEALVAQYSEDIASKPLGGSLGGVVAGHLISYPAILDALAALRPGQVSQVVETMYGFHVLMLRPPPAEETVSGAHIVIGYEEAPWLKNAAARSTIPERSRGEALTLAAQVYQRAVEHPDQFSQLVEQYSEHVDALRGGDLGSWSTHEEAPLPRELEVLRGLAVGAVAKPIDSLFGIQILRREPNRPRSQYAMTSIQLPFDISVPSFAPASPEAVLAQAQLVSGLLLEDAGRFAELQANQHSRPDPELWIEGRGAAPVEVALRGLAPGQIASAPMRLDGSDSYLIVKRLDPTEFTPPSSPRPRFELPAPTEPNLPYLFSEQLGRPLARQTLHELIQKAHDLVGEKPGSAERRTKLEALTSSVTDDHPTAEVAATFAAVLEQIELLLESAEYVQYRSWMNRHFEHLILGETPAPAPQ